MIVMKFGGTSVADGGRIAHVGRLAAAALPRGPVVVVSALGGVTDDLIRAATAAREGKAKEAEALLARLSVRHTQAVVEAGIGGAEAERLTGEIHEEIASLARWVQGISLLRELTPRTLDAISAAGELLSSRIVATALA